MSKRVTRRDILKLAGGSALGVLLTPLPWKLVDDSAIWTQNWSLVPALPRGPVSTRFSACTICPSNCPVRARCVGGTPVGLAGVAGHPFGDGALCAIGLAGHHMAFHPARIHRPWRRVRSGAGYSWEPVSAEIVLADIARRSRGSGHRIEPGVLDRRPGRCVSAAYRGWIAELDRGAYLTSHDCEDSTLRIIRRQTTPDPGPLAFDLEHAGLVVSFGAPLFEGWGSPAATRNAFRGGRPPRVVQVESRCSGTGRRADLRIALRPGTERAFALGIGLAVLEERLRLGSIPHDMPGVQRFRALAGGCSPEQVCRETGVHPDAFREVVRMVDGTGPAVAIGGTDPAGGPPGRSAASAIAALNVIFGSVNVRGGIIPRRVPAGFDADPADQKELRDVPEGSLGLLILDDAEPGIAMPEALIRRAVDPDAGMIIAFSPYLAGAALAADVVIPVPAPYESLTDVYSPATEPRWAMGLSAPLFSPAVLPDPRESFLGGVGRALSSSGRIPARVDAVLAGRIQALGASGPCAMLRPEPRGGTAECSPGDPAAVRSAMIDGAWWVGGEPGPGRPCVTSVLPAEGSADDAGAAPDATAGDGRLAVLPVGWKSATGMAAVPALAGKLYQESDLRRPGGHASVNPATAGAAGLAEGRAARVVTSRGSMEVVLHVDAGVMPGVIELSSGPLTRRATGARDPLSICEAAADGSWGSTPASLEAV